LNRVKKNELEKKAAKAEGKPAPDCKRHPKEPLGAHVVSTKDNEPQFLAPIPYEFVA
jgi:large subunit ribosomal protein L21e